MTYPEALQYLDSFINYEKEASYDYKASFNLDRIRALAAALGNPQDKVKSIHIAGTKGKGSTSAITYSILKESGFRVGLYTSPHLVSFRERIRVNDSLISEADTCRLLERVKKATDRMKDDLPTFFEVYTALAYLYFEEKHVDFAVYETGLGGRLDATNIIKSLVSAITPISYEHTDKLGNTLTDIAREKAGIIKEGSVCVLAPQEKEAYLAIEDICKARKAKIILVGRDIRFEELASDGGKEVFKVFGNISGEYPLLEMGLLGSHQVMNAATAIGIIEALRFYDITITPDSIRKGIASARWPGRLEVVSKEPFIVLDGAQNRASAAALASAVKKVFKYKRLILMLGVSKDKDVKGILEELLPVSDTVILTKSKVVQRAAEPLSIKALMPPFKGSVLLTSNVEEALIKAKSAAGKSDLILVAGSLFVAGEARNIFIKEPEDKICVN